MQTTQACERRAVEAPIYGAGMLLAFASAAVSLPIDALLRGMVAAGQGVEALLRYLDLTRAALEAHIVRLGLPMPHDRPLRRGGRHAWIDEDVRRLIAWRSSGVHPETIAVRLGRSVGAVRAKSRRLGVPTPARRDLRKLDPETLPDPVFETRSPSGAWSEPSVSVQARCGTSAGAPSVAGGAGGLNARTGELLPASGGVAAPNALKAPALRKARSASKPAEVPSQRDLPLLTVVVPNETPRDADEIAFVGVPSTESEVDLEGDLTWLSRMRDPQRTRVAVWTMGMLFMSGLHWREIAVRTGKTPDSIKTLRTRWGIPIVERRNKITKQLIVRSGEVSCLLSRYVIRRCMMSGNYFWMHKDDKGICICPALRRKLGRRDPDIEGRSPKFRLITAADLEKLPPHILAPFANREFIVGVA